jgi:hypothetical protein
MRLDFNLVVVDDDWDDAENNTNIKELIAKIDQNIQSKGFNLKYDAFSDPDDAFKNANKRVDLFLSDNNLGDNQNHTDPTKGNAGIDYYLRLRTEPHLCDFVLYTKSPTDEIIKKLTSDLNTKKDPNLFSRFTFVSREQGRDIWHQPILSLLDYILTRREEINTLRAIYAQITSRIDLHLKTKFSRSADEKFYKTIDNIPDHFGLDKNSLHEVRHIRNGLMHNDEEICPDTKQWAIKYEKLDGTTDLIRENDLQKYRDKLNHAFELVKSLP